MKSKAYTIRLNLDVEEDHKLYTKLEEDSKAFRSASDCIKNRLSSSYSRDATDAEAVIMRVQNDLLEKVYETSLKIISAVSGISINPNLKTGTQDLALPNEDTDFPDELKDILGVFQA